METNWLDTFKGFGTTLKSAAKEGITNTAQITVAAAADVLKSAGTDAILKTASKGTVKQPAKGVNADGSTVHIVPAGTAVNNQGQVVSTTTGMQPEKMMMIGGGILVAVILGVIVIKVVK